MRRKARGKIANAMVIAFFWWMTAFAGEPPIDVEIIGDNDRQSANQLGQQLQIALGHRVRISAGAWDSTRKSDVVLYVGPNGVPGNKPETAQKSVLVLNGEWELDVLIRRATWLRTELRKGQAVAFFLQQPLFRQLALARMLVPDARDVLVLVDADEKKQIETSSPGAADENIELAVLTDTTDLETDIKPRLQNADIVIHRMNGASLKQMKWLIYTAFQWRKPIVGYSRSYANAGAVAGIYTDKRMLTTHLVAAVDLLLKGADENSLATVKHVPPSIHFNRAVAHSLGLTIPTEHEVYSRLWNQEQPAYFNFSMN